MIELLNIDCMEYMATLPDKVFDLAIVDPPYGIKAHMGTNKTTKQLFAHRKHDTWDDKIPEKIYFDELFRCSNNQIIFGGDYFCHMLPLSCGWVVWDKKLRFFNFGDCEFAWVSPKMGGRLNQKRIFEYNPTNPSLVLNKIHPTQKPIKLYEWLLKHYAKPGQRILDTHLGSGSSAIAAHYFGLDFVGCELDTEYFNAAKLRFERQTRQTTLFDYEEVA